MGERVRMKKKLRPKFSQRKCNSDATTTAEKAGKLEKGGGLGRIDSAFQKGSAKEKYGLQREGDQKKREVEAIIDQRKKGNQT